MRKALGPIFHALARHKACRILAGPAMPDHVPRCIAIPPQSAVASVIGLLKGKSAITIARQLSGRERNCTGEPCWARGYAVSTVGFELEQVRASMREQEQADDEGRFERCL
jgi:putative transposase